MEVLPLVGSNVDLIQRRVYRRDGPIPLTAGEAAVLRTLADDAGDAVSREALLASVGTRGSDLRAVDQLIRRLRRKIEPDPEPRHLITVHGEGYRLQLPSPGDPGPPPGAIAAETDRFFGRGPELAQLADALVPGSAVTIAGPAGSGKTRLAVHVAFLARWGWSGGVWSCDLAYATGAEGACAAVAATLGLPAGPEVGRRIGFALRARGRALLVLDNVEQVAGAAPLVDGWRAVAPGLCVLATSRAPLGSRDEIVVDLPPLPLEREAAALFVDRAANARGGARLDPSSDDVQSLVRLLDGLPLAVELAAARTTIATPSQIADRMGRRLAFLRAQRRGARHPTLEAAFEASLQMLEGDEAEILLGLTAFAGWFTADDAAAVIATPHLPEILDALARRHLLQARSGRYRHYVALGAWARERAQRRDGWPAIAMRHLHHFAALGEGAAWSRAYGAEGDQVLAQLRAALPDLRIAIERGLAVGSHAAVGQCVMAATTAQLIDGPLPQALALAERGAALQGLPEALQRELDLRTAELLRVNGQPAAALAKIEAILAAAIASGDAVTEARASIAGIAAATFAGEADRASVLADRAVALATDQGSPSRIGRARNSRSSLRFTRGDLDGAVADLEASLAAFEGCDPAGAATALMNLWCLRFERGEYAAVAALGPRVEAAIAASGDRLARVRFDMHAAQIELERGDPEVAEARLRAARAILADLGDVRTEGLVVQYMANAQINQGCPQRAEQTYLEALDLHALADDVHHLAQARGYLGLARLILGRPREARSDLAYALQAMEAVGRYPLAALFGAGAAAAAARLGDREGAAASLAVAAARAPEGLILGAALAGYRAEVARALGDLAEARRAAQALRSVVEGHGFGPRSSLGGMLARLDAAETEH